MVIKPDDLTTEHTLGVGDKLAWVLVAQWRAIAQLNSVAQLHSVLSQAVAPFGIVVERKRIEKLCQRIGLRFRKPGRPRQK